MIIKVLKQQTVIAQAGSVVLKGKKDAPKEEYFLRFSSLS